MAGKTSSLCLATAWGVAVALTAGLASTARADPGWNQPPTPVFERAFEPIPTAGLPVHGDFVPPADWPAEIYLPAGTRALDITLSEDTATIELSPEILSQLDEGMLVTLFDEFRKLFYEVPGINSVRLMCGGKLLSSYLPPAPAVTPGPDKAEDPEGPATYSLMTTSLSGRKICIGPSHGRLWNGTAWGWQRGDSCGFGEAVLEDTNSIRLMQFLRQYLIQDGAAVYVPRQLNETDCCNPGENRYWWQLAAYSWIRNLGLPCSVWASNTGNCTSDTGPNRYNDDIRARPRFADYHNTDIYIAHHTNAFNGTASGTITYRDTAMEYPAHEANSYLLAQKVQSNICNVIKNVYGITDWYDRGVGDSAGGFGEIRIPNRPACLVELAFHDQCTRDALYLADNWFRSLTMWSIYKGVCEYFGVTPTWDMYSCEYVSDTIPTSVSPGQVFNASVTYRNRGVLWTSARNFKLGAVGDSDPFTSFNRVNTSGEVRPGDTFTFTFTMTAPSAPNLYTTDWQMTRDGIAWFGPVVSKQVTVGSGPFPPTITLHPASQSITAGGNASFTVEAVGTAPLTYQWQKNSVNVTNGGHYSGCTTATLTVSSADAGDAANYRCVVTNAQGNATSNAATLTVTTQPTVYIVESRSGGQNYTRYSETGTWSNSTSKSIASGVTAGVGSRFCTIGTGAGTAVFKFTPSASGSYNAYTTNCTTTNSGNPMVHVVTHAGGSTNVSVCQNSTCPQNACDNWYPLGTFTLNSGTEYSVTLNGYTSAGSAPSGNAGRSDAIKWESVGGTSGDPPSITQQPGDQAVTAGGTATFTVIASGTTPLSYQWQKNQANLTDGGHYSGAATATLTVSSVDSNDAASYRCVVTNAYGTATSNEAVLTIQAPPTTYIVESRSGGLNYAQYSETGTWSNSTAKSTTSGVTAGIGSRFCTIGTSAGTAVFKFTPSATGSYTVFTTNASTTNSGNPLIHTVTHASGSANVSVCQNSTCTPNPCNAWRSLGTYTLNAGTEYSVTLNGHTSAGSAPSGNAGRSDAIKWEATGGGTAPAITQQPSNVTVPAGGNASFMVAASGTAPLAYQWQKNQVNLTNGGHYSGSATATLSITGADSSDAANYRCVVTNAYGNATSNEASLTISNPSTTEFRGFWADVWGVGFKSTADINDMVNRAVQGRYNVIYPEVLAYHDSASSGHGAYWNSSIVPKAPDIESGLDPLAYLCQQAHAQGIQVHAWIIPFRASSVWPPTGNTTLINNSRYFMVPRANSGGGPVAFGSPACYYLDPGSPDVQEYIISIIRELVTNYPIDGVQFDYIRYVQADAGYPAVSTYQNSGLKRFQRITGRTDTPPVSGDTAWDDFRRRSITELVRRARAEIPTMTSARQPVRLSAAVVTWGDAPSTFQSSGAYGMFCNWEEWQRLGFLDTCVPMTYYAESSYPTWYRNWVNKEMTWIYNRTMVVGQGTYMNTFAQSVTQLQYARNAGAHGLCTYNYRDTTSDSSNPWDWYPYVATNLFTQDAAVPTMPWRSPATATEGTLWGRVTDSSTGNPIDDATVQVGSLDPAKTDGNGYFVVTLIPASGAGTSYNVSVSKSDYATGSRNATVVAGNVQREDFSLTPGGNPPVITQHPASVSVILGSTAVLAVQASGSSPLGYQWQKNSVNVTNGGHYAGCTTNTLVISSTDSNDLANYRCVVSNAYGNATSNQAALASGGALVESYIVESRSGGQNYAQYSETGTWSDSTAKSTASGCTAGIGSRFCTIGSSAGTAVFRFTPSTTGSYELFTTNPTTTNGGEPLIHGVTHAGGSTYNVSVCQNSTCSPNPCNAWRSIGTYSLTGGTQYTVTLNGNTGAGSAPSGNAGRSDAIRWSRVGSGPPTITQQPAAQSACPGGTAVFSVTASGEGTLTYQWQKNQANLTNGGHYSGCATTTLTVSSADGSDAANYRCVVTNAGGSTNSNEAALTLKAVTTITQHPSNQSVPTGGTANFTVAATGDGTLAYQWQKNSVNVTNGGHYSGCTTATLTVSNADSNDAANYRCVVTGGCGSATSNQATLTVTTIQTIIDDTFDSYANQTAFQTAWPVVGTSLTLSTTLSYSSPKSLHHAAGSTARQNRRTFTETSGTDASPVVLEFRLYDGGGATGNQWVELRDYSPVTQKQLIQVGLYTGQSGTYYSCRVAFSPGTGWVTMNQNGAAQRSTGWHLFKVVLKGTTADFYVDGVLAAANRSYASSVGAVSFEDVRVGSGLSSTSVSAYYDNVKLTKGQ
ncbi:MAG TPA: immunoglobulin domain-containing protein [Phycisphaerae bacterium]|nr:immunoglobulin domain-containing protein [Phycisphaerae bacterium]